jgi:branched-subunit amino acid transport protein
MNEIALIIGMMIATFLTRYPTMLLVSKIELPPQINRALKYVPIAVLSAIVAPLVLLQQGKLAISLDNSFFLAGIVSILVSWRSKNLILTIILGMASLWFFQYLFV